MQTLTTHQIAGIGPARLAGSKRQARKASRRGVVPRATARPDDRTGECMNVSQCRDPGVCRGGSPTPILTPPRPPPQSPAAAALSLALLAAAGPAAADSTSYDDMLKNFQAKQGQALKTYEKEAKKSSTLVRPNAQAPVSEGFSMGSFFAQPKAKPADEGATPAPAPKAALPKAPELKAPALPSFSAPAMPSFSAPKVEVPSFSAPKIDLPSFSAPKLPSLPVPPPPPPAPKKAPTPAAAAPAPVVKPYVPPPPPPPPPVRPTPPAPVPVPVPAPTPAASQGDFMEKYRAQQQAGGSDAGVGRKPAAREAQRKAAAAPAKRASGKRQGPLPLWLSEFLLLGAFGGFVAATVFAGDALKAVYAAADKALYTIGRK